MALSMIAVAVMYFKREDNIVATISGIIALMPGIAAILSIFKKDTSSPVEQISESLKSDDDLLYIKNRLEVYHDKIKSILKEHDADSIEKRNYQIRFFFIASVHLNLDIIYDSEDREKLVQYLQIFEPLAVEIKDGKTNYKSIYDSVMYGFLLAFRNPIILIEEVFPHFEMYEKLLTLCDKWTKYRLQKGLSIPFMDISLPQYNKYHWEKKKFESDVFCCSHMKYLKSYKHEIAALIYQSDPELFYATFGNDRENAVETLSRLLGMKNTIFSDNNVYATVYNGHVRSVIVLGFGNEIWDKNTIMKILGDESRVGDLFEYCSNEYFERLQFDNPNEDKAEIIACCVEETYRNKGYFHNTLTAIQEANPEMCFFITIPKNNKQALRAFRKMAFDIELSREGRFSPYGSTSRECYIGFRSPLIEV